MNKKEITFKNKYKKSMYNLFKKKNDKYYLLNTFSSSIVEIEEKEIEFVKKILNGDEIDFNVYDIKKFNEYREYLIENGFMIKEDINELEMLRFKYYKLFFNNQFLYITLLPTLQCNFKCPYCFETEKSLKWSDESVEILKSFAEKNFIKKEKVHIGLFGGEPLLEWNKIIKLFDYIILLNNKYNFNFTSSIATNGYLLNKNIIKKLINNYNCISFQISIDGNKNTHNSTRVLKNGNGTFDTVMNNLKILLSHYTDEINITLRINLLNNTIEDIDELWINFKMYG